MKNLLIVILLLSACQPVDSIKADAVIRMTDRQIAKHLIQGAFDDLWGGVDSTKISDYHTDDFIILEQGEVWDNNRIKQFMRGQLAQTNRPKRINKMEYISIDRYGPSMQIAYHNSADFTRADTLVAKAQWLESAVAVHTEDGWRLKMMHSTRVRN